MLANRSSQSPSPIEKFNQQFIFLQTSKVELTLSWDSLESMTHLSNSAWFTVQFGVWGELRIPADPDQYWGEGGEGSGFLEYQHHPVLYQSVTPCHGHTGTSISQVWNRFILSADDESVTQYDDVPHFIISLSQGSCCLMLSRIIISIYEIWTPSQDRNLITIF